MQKSIALSAFKRRLLKHKDWLLFTKQACKHTFWCLLKNLHKSEKQAKCLKFHNLKENRKMFLLKN